MSLKQNDSKDRKRFVIINKALFFCLTVHKTIDNEHRMYDVCTIFESHFFGVF